MVTQRLGFDFHSGLDQLPELLLTKPHLPVLLLYLVCDFDGLVNLLGIISPTFEKRVLLVLPEGTSG